MSSQYLASLTLFAATREQTVESRRRTFPQWGRGLTLEQYLTREATMDQAEQAVNGKLITWVLVPRNDPSTLDFKCSCETYRRKGLIKRPDSTSSEEVFGYGIASVFTPPQHRKKGHAGRMMRLLHWVLAPKDVLPPFPEGWGTPPSGHVCCGNAKFSVLYSDIGPGFYKSAGPDEKSEGWIVRDPVSTIWDVPKDAPNEIPAQPAASVKWLTVDACEAIWDQDVALMKADLASTDTPRTVFTFLPDAGVSAYLVRRTIFFISGHSLYELPTKWGITLQSIQKDEHSVTTSATWTLDVRPPPPTLIVTRLRTTKESFPQLVFCMLSAARESQMERVEVWNLPMELQEIASSLGGKTLVRDEHLNAFKWYGPEKSEDLEWAFNEKFAWC
ncbi:hypothetical protein EW145_g2828 [Phellinidium pouzarii]|uniref:LYC1 C-terminal domain-containing protein n=1 Tax=Phellinidium pouzarii TaxID=167371 RepID=A0A4S4L9W2_9AGAM|nr:hypothetical protein EW145_g2828 [Phellinidium pouzarii]